jgi:predicted ATP-grasp superfamily ATP-dependent carboligase
MTLPTGGANQHSSAVATTSKPLAAEPIAVVTDGMWRKSLAVIRSLGKAGFRVHVLGDSRLTVGFWSRFTKRRVMAPDAKENAAGFGEVLSAYLRDLAAHTPSGTRPILLPMEEDSLRYVISQRDTLRRLADFLVPDAEAFEICANKGATMALAARLGVPHPRTELAETAEQLVRISAAFSGSEFVVKPVRGVGSSGVRYNPKFDAESAGAYFQKFGSALIQERVPPEGDAIGVSLLFGADGECLAHFCHQRLQQYPNSGGPSTDRIGISAPDLLEKSLLLMRALKWKGVAMVEWKVDPRDGTARLLEINPRFWGSLELAIRSGVNFPLMYAQAAAGQPTGYAQPIDGIRTRWLIPGDVLRWLTAKSSRREPLGVFLKGLPGQAEEWDSHDLAGTLASVVCQGLAVLQPKYWKFLSR